MRCKSITKLPSTSILGENDSALFIQNDEAVAVALDVLRKAIFESRTYWESLLFTVSEYVYLDTLCTSGKEEAIYRLVVQDPIKSIVGTDTMYCVRVANKERLFLADPFTGALWTYVSGSNNIEKIILDIEKKIAESGAVVTLTLDQIDALDKLFELAAYTDESISTAYNNFITAFGLDRYRVMRVIDSNGIFPCGVSNYYDVGLVNTQWLQYNGIPYTRTVNEAVENASEIDRSCYPYFDIPAEGGYSYQIYFEATNADVQISLEFYNETALAAIAAGEDYSQSDRKDGYGWQSSMGYEWTPPTEYNGSLIKAMRLNFSSKDAGIQKVIIYRKKVV